MDGGYLIVGTEYMDKTNKSEVVVCKVNAFDEVEWKY